MSSHKTLKTFCLVSYIYIPPSQPPSALLPSPSPSAQKLASPHPPSSATQPGTPDAWPYTSAVNCENKMCLDVQFNGRAGRCKQMEAGACGPLT